MYFLIISTKLHTKDDLCIVSIIPQTFPPTPLAAGTSWEPKRHWTSKVSHPHGVKTVVLSTVMMHTWLLEGPGWSFWDGENNNNNDNSNLSLYVYTQCTQTTKFTKIPRDQVQYTLYNPQNTLPLTENSPPKHPKGCLRFIPHRL